MPKRLEFLPGLAKALSAPDGSKNAFVKQEPAEHEVALEAVTAPPKRKRAPKAVKLHVSYRRAAEMLGIDRGTKLLQLIARRELKPVQVGGRKVLLTGEVEALALRGWPDVRAEGPVKTRRRRTRKAPDRGGLEAMRNFKPSGGRGRS